MQFQNEKILLLQGQLNSVQPKIDFYDAVTGSKDLIDMNQAGKLLGIGRNNLFEFLRNNRILRHNNEPYQRYIDSEWFKIIEVKYTKPNGDVGITIKTLVFQKGVDAILKMLNKGKGE